MPKALGRKHYLRLTVVLNLLYLNIIYFSYYSVLLSGSVLCCTKLPSRFSLLMSVFGTTWFANFVFSNYCLIRPICTSSFSTVSYENCLYITWISDIFACLHISYKIVAEIALSQLRKPVSHSYPLLYLLKHSRTYFSQREHHLR